MKKLLLIAFAATAFTAADAAASLSKSWEKTVAGTFDDKGAIYNAPVAIDKAGNIIATGAFNKEITIGSAQLEYDFGTNAYLAKYDVKGDVKWAVSITGSVTLTAIDTDDDGNIYVAGVYADEIVFNTTSGEPMSGEGAMIDGVPTQEQNASFIAKYDADGKVLSATYYVPEKLTALANLGEDAWYWPEDGDIYFRINHIKSVGDKVYASASYTGQTRKSNGKYLFEASYFEVWGMPMDCAASSIFTVDSSDLKGIAPIARMGLAEPAVIDEEGSPMCKTTNFLVDEGKLYAAFGTVGAVTLSTQAESKILEKEQTAYSYVFAEIDPVSGAVSQYNVEDFADKGESMGNNVFAGIYAKDGELYALGFECVSVAGATPDAESTNGYDMFAFVAPKSNLAEATKKVKSVIEGIVTYYRIHSAAQFADGSIVLNALGYYNATEGDKKNGNFAGSLKTLSFDGDTFSDWTLVPEAIGMAASGSSAVFSSVADAGITYSAFTDSSAGVDNVTVADPNAPVEYYNLQGIRVAEPSTGVYIRRQGDKVSKVLVK